MLSKSEFLEKSIIPMKLFLIIMMFCILTVPQLVFGSPRRYEIGTITGPASEDFGISVATSGDYAIIGASYASDNGTGSGAAYFFKRENGTWSQQERILASDPHEDDNFGYPVAIDGDYAVVAAPWKTVDNLTNAGQVYIFKRNGTDWSQEAILKAPTTRQGAAFGYPVSISGDYVMIAAGRDNRFGVYNGAAYIFKRNGTSWPLHAELLPPDDGVAYQLGRGVSIDGENAVAVSSQPITFIYKRDGDDWNELSGGATVVQGSVTIDNDFFISGAIRKFLIYKWNGTSWDFNKEIYKREIISFAGGVDISGSFALVSAYQEKIDGVTRAGMVYLYEYDGSDWIEQSQLLALERCSPCQFGHAISINGNDILIGGYSGDASGIVYIFEANPRPDPPSALTATTSSSSSSSQIDLAWTDNSSDETGFKIERKATVSGNWIQIDTAAADVVAYPDKGLSALTTYYYRVKAYNDGGDSASSNEDSAATQDVPSP